MIERLTERIRLSKLISQLKVNNCLPETITVTKIGSITHACLGPDPKNIPEDQMIEYDLSASTSFSPEKAIQKAIGEFIERKAFCDWALPFHDINLDSTGFACMPYTLRTRSAARRFARQKAYCELVERFVWNEWWDNEQSGYQYHQISPEEFVTLGTASPFLAELAGMLQDDIVCLHVVSPSISDKTLAMSILILEYGDGQFVAGGACEPLKEKDNLLFRAASELYQHYMIAENSLAANRQPSDSYEGRLLYFASGEGAEIFRRRISTQGNETIVIPPVSMDQEIEHTLSSIAYVHRCAFATKQPHLFGGPIEKLCY